MRLPNEISENYTAEQVLSFTPIGSDQVVASKRSEEILGIEKRAPNEELKRLCVIFEEFKNTNDEKYIRAASQYIAVWGDRYNPSLEDTRLKIPLDQRYFSWVFIEIEDCWSSLSKETQAKALSLAQTVLNAENSFWSNERTHNNIYSYSTLNKITALGILTKREGSMYEEEFSNNVEQFFKQVRENVYDTGEVLDFMVRDSVHYQVFNQIAWEMTRTYLLEHGVDIPGDVIEKLDKSLSFCMDFIKGNRTHVEFVNSTHKRDAQIQKNFGGLFDKGSLASKTLISILQTRNIDTI